MGRSFTCTSLGEDICVCLCAEVKAEVSGLSLFLLPSYCQVDAFGKEVEALLVYCKSRKSPVLLNPCQTASKEPEVCLDMVHP